MDVIVCIKRVPDTEARIRIDGSGSSIESSGIKYDMSPYDAFAVEAAIRLKESLQGDGDVSVLTLGDSSSGETLRKALAMGADRAVLLNGQVSLDGLATAKALAAELEGSEADLFLFGIKAADDDQQQVGQMVSVLSGRPCVSGVSSFEIDGHTARCKREVEGGSEIVEVDLPAVLCITKGSNEPRLPALKGIMAAKKKPLEERPAQVSGSRVRLIGLSTPPPRAEGRIVGEGPDAVPELVRILREDAHAI
ncbi:MAG TPA: electron transfer flavoprotein subunit beta [Gemmatimonadetes bacterium]|nr:electron transfer flavoprotein subunit beta [Gemmatimonadota bacterium]HAT36938.1 electron transfer flavoprotein subunit beta [Gemmatimonadota bacterium]HBV06858.1 electron transfer flavoprotein subunit beta [Gemmatimonadota bacterium]HCO14099.1 electron transfer flavoprotein subunit beta [Gemmatimonadota bacterium]